MGARRIHGFAPPWQWGIFRRSACRRLKIEPNSPDYEPMIAIYRALKSAGFVETYWQFVYPGQIGGLIKAPQNSLIEFHVRFFEEGMIYSEMELGRSVFLHFINQRRFVNCYVSRVIGSRLSPSHAAYLKSSAERYKLKYDNQSSEWTIRNRFITRRIKMQIRFLTVLSDWRTLALIMLASVVSTATEHLIVLPLVTAAMIFVYLFAPRRSQ